VYVSAELAVLSRLWFELGKWRIRICGTFGLPFPVHGAFLCAPVAPEIVESHIANVFATIKATFKAKAGKVSSRLESWR
jgi:hypothetical protein